MKDIHIIFFFKENEKNYICIILVYIDINNNKAK